MTLELVLKQRENEERGGGRVTVGRAARVSGICIVGTW